MQMPARITDIRTSTDMDTMRAEVAAGAVADQFKAAVDAFGNRTIDYDRRAEQSQTALYHMLGGMEEYLRRGGDPDVVTIVANALDFAASH